MSSLKLKQVIIRTFDAVHVFRLGSRIQRACFGPDHIRAVNYHGTPEDRADDFERQLRFYSRHFEPADKSRLERLLAGNETVSHPSAAPVEAPAPAVAACRKTPASRKPGLLISFDDGLLSSYEVAAPLLEKYGFAGWFFVPVALIGDPRLAGDPEHRERIRSRHGIDVSGEADGRPAFMNWEQVRDLDRRHVGHVIGCHTMNHCRLYERETRTEEKLRQEIVASKADLERQLGHEVDTFCWVGGEEESYSRRAAELIAEAGYRFSFMTNLCPITAGTSPLQLQRTNVEAGWPMPQVRFCMSGVMDVAHAPKRRRVNRLTRTG